MKGWRIGYTMMVLMLSMSACERADDGAGDDEFGQPASCQIVDQNRFVLEVMQEIYFWNDQLPTVDPTDFATPADLLEALRFRPLDRFSQIADAARFVATLQGEVISFGLGALVTDNGEARVRYMIADSPAGRAGLVRGERVLAVDGRPIHELITTGGNVNPQDGLKVVLQPEGVGAEVVLRIQRTNGLVEEVPLVSELLTLSLVPITRIFEVAGRPTGYLFFLGYAERAINELNGVFEQFRAAGVRDIILDLRYNGGGEDAVTHHLLNLIGGIVFAGEPALTYLHNANRRFRDTTFHFAPNSHSIAVDRVVALTTRDTVSASEGTINALQPYLEVITVGETTNGKAWGSPVIPFCSQVLVPMASRTTNALQHDVSGGIAPDCAVPDDLDHILGDPAERLLAEALFYLQHGRCSGP